MGAGRALSSAVVAFVLVASAVVVVRGERALSPTALTIGGLTGGVVDWPFSEPG